MRFSRKGYLALLLAAVVTGCSSGSPVAQRTLLSDANGIEAAHVLVGGVPVEGAVIMGEHGTTLFEVRMRDRDPGSLASVGQVLVRYHVPAGGMMPHRNGETPCFDDGTHGDDVPGDGIFHRRDDDGMMGCGRANSPSGTYAYTMHCILVSGESCGDVALAVTRL